MDAFLFGIDVGTGSVRAGLFDMIGKRVTLAIEPIRTWQPIPNYVEQSSEDIWDATSRAIRTCLHETGINPDHVKGISFDATCSLVVLGANDESLSIDLESDPERNVIVWMDHRALAEANRINAGKHGILEFVGGTISPEMQTPKLMWIKGHLPHIWQRARRFFDLADYLTYRASGRDARSLCTVVCKWAYQGHLGPYGGWDRNYLASIGLDDLLIDDKIGADIRPMGSALGPLTPRSADELGLSANCIVAVGMIDAHAGGLGLLGNAWQPSFQHNLTDLETTMALIGGTSNCHMAVSHKPIYVEGVWGPYLGAMVPDMWLTEGGQSAAGSAIDYMIVNHPNYPNLQAQAKQDVTTVYHLLNQEISRLTRLNHLPCSALLTKDIHVLPDFLGNRSPYSDPSSRGVIEGLDLDSSITSQALRYYATLQAVAYGTRDIVRVLNEAGYSITSLIATGGGTKNELWLQEHADATGLSVTLPEEPEAVLLGTAMLAAVGAGVYPDLPTAMQKMSRISRKITPHPATKAYHDLKFDLFCEMYQNQRQRRERMSRS